MNEVTNERIKVGAGVVDGQRIVANGFVKRINGWAVSGWIEIRPQFVEVLRTLIHLAPVYICAYNQPYELRMGSQQSQVKL